MSSDRSHVLDRNNLGCIPQTDNIWILPLLLLDSNLKDGDKIISVRNLSTRHNINPLTILKAYNQLEGEGFLYSKRGSGYYVKADYGKYIEEKKTLLKKEVSAFYKKIISLGFTLNELQQELKRQLEVKKWSI